MKSTKTGQGVSVMKAILHIALCLSLIMPSLMVPCSAENTATASAAADSFSRPAPDLTGGVGWLNTDKPLTLQELHGKIVLLDFWTFCCINCMHVIPQLHQLELKYPHELVVIGVHSAKFENEKESENIRKAILRYDIGHPVINDANFVLWNKFDVHAWPTFVLIDPDGNIVATKSGEGAFQFFDAPIQQLIDRYSQSGKLNRNPLHFVLEKDKVSQTPLAFPGKIAFDPERKVLYISDSGHNRIVVCDLDGKVHEVIGSGKEGRADGGFCQASFHHPQGLACSGNKLYVADTENHLLRLIDLEHMKVSTIAGTGQQAPRGATGGTGTEAALNSPWDLVLIGRDLYVAMAGAHQIWRMNLDDKTIHPYAGDGRENIIDGAADEASLAQPSGITADGKKLYFADSEVSSIRECDVAHNGKVSTIIGKGLFKFGDVDGVQGKARLQHPLGVLSYQGTLYVADSYNHKIKVVDPHKHTATTFAGTGKPGDVDGTSPQFSEPAGLAAVGNTLYVADTNNNCIRKINFDDKSVSTLKLSNIGTSK